MVSTKKTNKVHQRPATRDKLNLDEFLRGGRLKLARPDIREVWSEQRHINKKQEKAFEEKIRKLKSSYKKIKSKASSPKLLKKVKTSKLHKVKLPTKLKNRKAYMSIIGLFLVIAVTGIIKVTSSKKISSTDTLGASTQASNIAQQDIPEVKTTDFDLVWPAGKSEKDFKIVKISPQGNEPVYTYVDKFAGADIKISQQKLPDSFKSDRDQKLLDLANSFQATNIIQIDDSKVYHGFSEKTKVQSLILIKKDLLIFISSTQKLNDDDWAGYITALK